MAMSGDLMEERVPALWAAFVASSVLADIARSMKAIVQGEPD
jgi:hypothetical protein